MHIKHERIIKTCNLYSTFFALGLGFAVMGPCLIDLQKSIHTDTKHIALIYTAKSIGVLIGSIVGGILLDVVRSKLGVLTVLNFMAAVTSACVPWCTSFKLLMGCMAVNGACLGGIETGSNVVCLRLWGKDSGPFFQGMHFTFGLGGIIAPLIAAPFLTNYNLESEYFENNTTTFTELSQLKINNFTFNNTPLSRNNSEYQETDNTIPSIIYPFSIIGGFGLFVTLLLLVVCLISPTEDGREDEKKKTNSERTLLFMLSVIVLNFLIIFFVTGTEIGVAQMLTSYAVKGPLKLTVTTGSYITSAYWFSFTVTRLASVFLSIKFRNLTLILWDLIILSISATMFLSLRTQEWALWLNSVIYGIGVASFYAATVGWLAEHVTMTNKISSVVSVGVSAGEMVIPFVISYFIELMPEIFPYVITASCVFLWLIVGTLYLIFTKSSKKNIKKGGDCYIINASSAKQTSSE